MAPSDAMILIGAFNGLQMFLNRFIILRLLTSRYIGTPIALRFVHIFQSIPFKSISGEKKADVVYFTYTNLDKILGIAK